MAQSSTDDVRNAVREHYAKVAETNAGVGCVPSCCGPQPSGSARLGYSSEELAAAPEGANMGLGCGNPQAVAALKPGEAVLDLGSGGGFDSFLAARQVGPSGSVIGVDMTPQMVTKARDNARKLRDEERFAPWIYRVAKSAVVESHRQRARHAGVEIEDEVQASLAPEPSEPSPLEKELSVYLVSYIAMLPSPYREAVTLTELEGLTQKAAADALGISLSGMKSRVQRGREKLRELLEACCRIGVDARGHVIECEPRDPSGCRCKNS